MRPFRNLLIIVILLLASISYSHAQTTIDVSRLISNPSEMIDRVVTIEGTVVRHVEEVRDVITYEIEDRFGDRIYVRTVNQLPETNIKIRVTGTFQESGNLRFINELNRSNISGFKLSPQNLVLIILGIVILCLFIFLIYLIANKGKIKGKNGKKDGFSSPPPSPLTFVDNPTIKMNPTNDKTIVLLPGKLEVLSGIDGLKLIQFKAPRGARNNEFTFGRNPGSEYTHIQLKSPTISREQAKLIVSRNIYTIINYSDANPTMLNGVSLEVNESQNLNVGDVITMGEVSLKFVK